MSDEFAKFKVEHLDLIEERIVEFSDRKIESADHRLISLLYKELQEYFLRPGKRVRPLTFLLAASGYGSLLDKQSALYDVAAIIEVLHSYLLIHDDIVDRADTRRGGKALHITLQKFSEFSDPQAAGMDLALIAGDLLVCDAIFHITTLDLTECNFQLFMNYFSKCYAKTNVGQFLDVYAGACHTLENVDLATQIATHKTAYYTFVYPFLLGYLASGGKESKEIQLIEEVFFPLGVAFQKRDDLIGAFAETAESGKVACSDLVESKVTTLIAAAMDAMSEVKKREFAHIFSKYHKKSEEIMQLKHMILDTGCYSVIKDEIITVCDNFTRDIAKLNVRSECVDALQGLARLVAKVPI